MKKQTISNISGACLRIQDVSELMQEEGAGARFSKGPGNFSSPKANFRIQTCCIAAQFLAHKLVNFASLTDSFILLFSKVLKL